MEQNLGQIAVSKLALAGVLLLAAQATIAAYAQQSTATPPPTASQTGPSVPQSPASAPPSVSEAAPAMGAAASQPAPAVVRPPDPSLTVPAGTKVLLSVESPVNTRTAKPGDGIYLVSTFPVIVGPKVLIPAGVYVQGVVDQVQRPGRVKGRAKLLMHFTTMIFPNGQVVTIPGGVNNLPGSTGPTVKNSEGEIEQAGNKGKDAGNIAKGAGVGVGVGGIGGEVGGHAVEGLGYGALGGAAGGLIYTLLTRGDEISITAGTAVEMVLQRPLVLEPSQLAGINDTQGRPQYVPSAAQQSPMAKPRVAMTCPPGHAGLQLDPAAIKIEARNPAAVMIDSPLPVSTEPVPVLPPEPPQRPFRLWLRDLVFSVAASFFIITFLYQPGEGGRHQHAAAPGRPGPPVHQQVCLSV